ncbi:hypothetical protein SAICODRAFT_29621 [Saitoella complicata NRRL Y-17804]|uniref:uncharacterized protein n=1 Tax=Saitoella complicata (strain BCRC 22490 / CBS 7301 / JCM 7358 / NBRC 10748 / NRRL Y-17804) TaxID=698492 RepID=UPI0008680243|nr:uncharacterized protein SAICODRAFT_29621 [Saitoella complicata NRRL Y-17804]ODQ54567.1 hypothetical protein SAICODRAFT_29621 [Saitoella complicata NRRL Y-17804]
MTAALAFRRRDEGKENMAGQILIYPETRLPFDTKVCQENNATADGSHLYLEANGIPGFAQNYLPMSVPPSTSYTYSIPLPKIMISFSV